CANGQSTNDPVPLRKRATQRFHSRRRFAPQITARRDLLGEPLVLGRIHFQKPAAEYRNRPATSRKRTTMRGRIDPARETAHHRKTSASQTCCQALGLCDAVSCSMTRADNGNGQLILRCRLTTTKQYARRIVN